MRLGPPGPAESSVRVWYERSDATLRPDGTSVLAGGFYGQMGGGGGTATSEGGFDGFLAVFAP